jgi:hypothetical protein
MEIAFPSSTPGGAPHLSLCLLPYVLSHLISHEWLGPAAGGNALDHRSRPRVCFQDGHPLGLVMIGVESSGIVLLTLGLPGIVARQASRAGWLGFIGFLLLLLNWLLLLGVGAMLELTILPWLDAHAPQVSSQLLSTNVALSVYIEVRYVLLVLGGVLLGIATMRAGVFSRWAGLLLNVGVVLSPASYELVIFSTLANVLVSLGLGWMGYTLWIIKGEAAPQHVPAS